MSGVRYPSRLLRTQARRHYNAFHPHSSPERSLRAAVCLGHGLRPGPVCGGDDAGRCNAGALAAAPAPEALTLRVIVVASDDEARQVIARLKQGADFAAVAASVSQDPTRNRGGLLGRTSLSSLRQELREALQGLSVGQITRPVRVPTGYAVLKVVEDCRGGATSPPPAECPPRLQQSERCATCSTSRASTTRRSSCSGTRPSRTAGTSTPSPSAACGRRLCWRRSSTCAPIFRPPNCLRRDGRWTSPRPTSPRRSCLRTRAGWPRPSQACQRRCGSRMPVCRRMRLHMEEALGIAYLHKAMHDNGAYHAPGDRCLLSLDARPVVRAVR